MKPILVATDGSPSADGAVRFALALAQSTHWPLHAIVAWAVPTAAFAFETVSTLPQMESAQRDRALAIGREVETAAREADVRVDVHVRNGEPVDEICKLAQSLDAAMIVVGARGWSAARRLVFGSVSHGVLHHAGRPVLVVHGGSPVDPTHVREYEGVVLTHEP